VPDTAAIWKLRFLAPDSPEANMTPSISYVYGTLAINGQVATSVPDPTLDSQYVFAPLAMVVFNPAGWVMVDDGFVAALIRIVNVVLAVEMMVTFPAYTRRVTDTPVGIATDITVPVAVDPVQEPA
jgi:hypothetical protein